MTRICCLTMMADEDFFLPIWARYYGGLFGPENLFIIDDCSSLPLGDMWPAKLGRPNIFTLPDKTTLSPDKAKVGFDLRRFQVIQSFVSGLLGVYDVVIFNDTDEFFLPDPAKYPDLRAYLEDPANRHEALAGMGLTLFHRLDSEDVLDPARPVLEQRRHAVLAPLYAKPHILTEPSRMWPHAVSRPFRFDPDLYLVHLRYVDRDQLLERQKTRKKVAEIVSGGVGVEWTRDHTDVIWELTALNALPVSTEPFDVRAEMAGRMPFTEATTLSHELHPPVRKESVKPGRNKMIDYIRRQDEKAMEAQSHVLPERFVASGL